MIAIFSLVDFAEDLHSGWFDGALLPHGGILILNEVMGDDFISYKIRMGRDVMGSDAIPMKVTTFWVTIRIYILYKFK